MMNPRSPDKGMQPHGAEGSDKAVALMTRYIGLDIHKDYIHGCEWTSHEAREKHFRLKNNRDAWTNLAKMFGPDCEVAYQ
jgi:hypothetical protein